MGLLDDFSSLCSDVRSLANGGQKTVMSAVHPDFGSVVIKHGEYRYTSLDRIAREVEILKDIDSEYYPTHYEFLIDPVNREFLVVEERLEAVELMHAKSRFSTDDAILKLLIKLLCALDVLWQKGVVHRDIKPANILITSNNEPRIIDLGIARCLGDTSLTATMAAHGPATPIYSSPEQLANKKSMIGVRTDFYLLGILILELMHGFHPFDTQYVGNNSSLINNICDGIYVHPDVTRDPRLVGFVEGVLKTMPYNRIRTIDEAMKQIGMDRKQC